MCSRVTLVGSVVGPVCACVCVLPLQLTSQMFFSAEKYIHYRQCIYMDQMKCVVHISENVTLQS